MLARLAVWEREMMSEERACATLEGAGRILADRGLQVWKDNHWGIWEAWLEMRLNNWAGAGS